MSVNDKYNKLVYEIEKLKNYSRIKAKNFSLENNEFQSIIDQIERDNLFNKGRLTLNEEYIFMGLTFQGQSFIENNDGKEYSKIERVEVENHTHINIGKNNNGNIVVGNDNSINSKFDQKFYDLLNAVKKSDLQDKENILEELNTHKNNEIALKQFMGTLLTRGEEVTSIIAAIGAITSKMLTLATSIGEELTKIEFEANKTITPMLRRKNRIKTLAGTLEIEGNFIGKEKITAIIDGKRVLGTIPEIAEVKGAIKAYQELENYKYDDISDLLKAHKVLMNEILNHAGNFRTSNVRVGEYIAPQLMNELFRWLKNSDEHLLLKSCIFHYEFEFIHPFIDGNGRIGRLWQSVILYNYNPLFASLPTESIVRNHQEEYYKALEDSTALGESTPFNRVYVRYDFTNNY